MKSFLVTLLLVVTSCYGRPNRQLSSRQNRRGRSEGSIKKAFEDYQCVTDTDLGTQYIVPHPFYCDQFYLCKDGLRELQICRDGYGLDLTTGTCQSTDEINCGKRTQLYATSHDNLEKCPLRNGFFPIEDECEVYTECSNGKDYRRTCSSGSVFDTQLVACVHPDQTTRSDCLASKFLNFECPELEFDDYGNLPFGDHDRLAHPSECNKFFSCDFEARPRLNSCPEPTVFNPKTGFCSQPDEVQGCENFYADSINWQVGTIDIEFES